MSRRILMTGASGGVGSRLAALFLEGGDKVTALSNPDLPSRETEDAKRLFNLGISVWGADLSQPHEIRRVVEGTALGNLDGPAYDIFVHAAGVNAIKPLGDITENFLHEVMQVNTFSFVQLVSMMLPKFKASGTSVCSVISNASMVPFSNSVAYNMSKSALWMATRQMAHELRGTGITMFGVSPNKLSGTNMSKYIDEEVARSRNWTPEQVHDYQVQSLPAGKETDPQRLAEFLHWVLQDKSRHEAFHGTVLPYGGPYPN